MCRSITAHELTKCTELHANIYSVDETGDTQTVAEGSTVANHGGFFFHCSDTVQVLVDNGGNDLPEFIRKNMKFIFGNDLARHFNVMGQRGQRAFKSLKLFDILYGTYIANNAFLNRVSQRIRKDCITAQ